MRLALMALVGFLCTAQEVAPPAEPAPAAAAAPAPAPAAAPATPPDPREEALAKLLEPKRTFSSGVKAAVLRTKDKDLALDGLVGGFATTYAFVTVLFYSDFPEREAVVRVKDNNPSLLVRFDTNPRGRLFFVKLKQDWGRRSLKMGKSGFGSISAIAAPDQDWVIPATFNEAKPGLWEFKAKAPLAKGEYGLFASMAAGATPGGLSGELFDFAVE